MNFIIEHVINFIIESVDTLATACVQRASSDPVGMLMLQKDEVLVLVAVTGLVRSGDN